MIKDCKQGDIFEVGNYGRFSLILVFAPHGMSLRLPWRRFRDKYVSLSEIDDPFQKLSTPTEFSEGRWIQFSQRDDENNGMDDSELEEHLKKTFSWAIEKGIKRIITTGVRDVSHDEDSGDRRIRFIKEICSRKVYNQPEITLISKDRSYVEGEDRSPFSRHFLSSPDVIEPPVTFAVSEEENESFYESKLDNNEIGPLKEFYVVATPQPHQMQYIVQQMKETLLALTNKKIPNETDYIIDDLKKYCQSLVSGQSRERRPFMHGCWSPVNNISDLPRELRDDCLYYPSIIASATLSRILIDFPEIALKTKGFSRAIQSGFRSLCHRNQILGTRMLDPLRHNIFQNDLFFEAIELLCEGGVIKVLNEYPDVSNEMFKVLLAEIKIVLSTDLDCGYIERNVSKDGVRNCQSVLNLLEDVDTQMTP